MKKIILFLTLQTSITLQTIYAQPVTQEWVRRYSDTVSAFYSASSIRSDNAGYIYVLAETNNDFGFIKYDQNGSLLVAVTHWPSGGFESGGGTCFDVTPAGDVYITGEVNMGFSGWIYTVKFNSGGAFQWGKLVQH
jgi:hypothetical protein